MKPKSELRLVIIGASAGGVVALDEILPRLPLDFAPALVVILHQPASRQSLLAELFARKCRLPVREAYDKAAVEPGHVYFAPPDYHLLIEQDLSFVLSLDEPVNFSRPSIDVLLQSAAASVGDRMLAIILTGNNADGAEGLKAVRQSGGLGWVQNPDSALAPAMPKAAIGHAGADEILTLAEMAERLAAMGSGQGGGPIDEARRMMNEAAGGDPDRAMAQRR